MDKFEVFYSINGREKTTEVVAANEVEAAKIVAARHPGQAIRIIEVECISSGNNPY